MKRANKVSTKATDKGARVGIGYIMLPPEVNRNAYVATCYKSSTVSIALEDGGFYADVPISTSCLNLLDFPQTQSNLGSQVIWARLDTKGFPVILGIINKANEIITFSEHEFELKKELDSLVSVKGNAAKGTLSILVDGGSTILGRLDIKVRNSKQKGKINIDVDDQLSVKAGNKLSLKTNKAFSLEIIDKSVQQESTKIDYELGRGLLLEDEWGNKIELTEDFLQSKVKEFIVGDGSEPVLLGDSFVKQVQKEDDVVTAIINEIIKAPTTPTDGGAGFKASLVTALQRYLTNPKDRADYSEVRSEVTKTD